LQPREFIGVEHGGWGALKMFFLLYHRFFLKETAVIVRPYLCAADCVRCFISELDISDYV